MGEQQENSSDWERAKTHRYSEQQKGVLAWLFKKKQETGFNLFPWSVPEYLGRRPRPSESAGLSRTLIELETLGDVELLDVRKKKNEDKRRRTTHIRLSTQGREVAAAFANGYDVTRTWHRQTITFNAGRYLALSLASYLIEQEQHKVASILEADPDDYRPYGLPSIKRGPLTTKQEAEEYARALHDALELFTKEQHKLGTEFKVGAKATLVVTTGPTMKIDEK